VKILVPQAERAIRPGPVPSLSVIVAAYQAADVIGDALESIRRQTVRPLEVVVCDDGSTDELDAALEPYMDEIRLLRKQHGGEASAKNAAAHASSGEFVVILDADDVFMPERLEALTELARLRPDLDILTTDAYLTVDGRPVRRCYHDRWRFEIHDQRRAILERNFVFGLAAVRRERLLARGGFDESILWTTDWDCWIRLILDGSRVGAVIEPLALYRVREESLSSRRRDLLLGKKASLEKAARNPALTDEERRVVARALASHDREIRLLDLRATVGGATHPGRQAAIDIARDSQFSVPERVRAAAIATAPAVARRLIRRSEARTWTGAGGTQVSRQVRPDSRVGALVRRLRRG
jgi:Glycosyl transferase family 2